MLELIGQRFDVVVVPSDDAVLESPRADITNVGTIRLTPQRITIAGSMGPDQARDTLLHEVLHGLLRIVNLIPDDKEEERVVVALAPLLLDALRRNPGLVEYLVAA